MSDYKEPTGKAGAIVLHPDHEQIALVYRAKEGDWTFPKGHIENGETPLVACLREVKEEIGLDVDVLVQLPDNIYIHKTGKKICTHMYLARARGSDFIAEHPGDRIEWVDLKEVLDRLSYDGLKMYYKEVQPIIEKALP